MIRHENPCADAITVATRQYAKRQDTWFRNQLPAWLRLDGTQSNIVAKMRQSLS